MTKLTFGRKHALEAIRQAKEHGRDWLYAAYPAPGGRAVKSRTGFLLFDGVAYPVKPLGRLASEIAGTPLTDNPDTTVFRRRFQSLDFQLCNDDFKVAQEDAERQEAEAAVERQRRQAEVWSRPGQAQFRRNVFAAFGARCLISGCATAASLEAAHVVPVADGGEDAAWNGIPLRADLHRLFDAGQIAIDPDDWTVVVGATAIIDYRGFQGERLSSRIAGHAYADRLAAGLRTRVRPPQ